MIGSHRRGQEGRLLLPFQKVGDDIKTTVGMSKKDSTAGMRPCVAEIRVRSATASSRDYTNRALEV
jgi:hypothetical protein